MPIPHILTDRSLTVVLGATPYAVPRDHCNFEAILDALRANDNEDSIRRLVDVPAAVADFTRGKIEVFGRDLYFDGAKLHNGLATRILDLLGAGDATLAEPLCVFLDNVMEQPDDRAKTGLYDWLAASNLPITDDGHFLAWKIVGPDYRPISTLGTYRDEHIPDGRYVSMPRGECDTDPDTTCSSGLHFCSTSYLPSYGTVEGNRVVVVKIHPRDVVAFPRDYNLAKGRACGYFVVDEVTRDTAPTRYEGQPVVDTPPPFPWKTSDFTGSPSIRGKRIARWERATEPVNEQHAFDVWLEVSDDESGPYWYKADGTHIHGATFPTLSEFPFVATQPTESCLDWRWEITGFEKVSEGDVAWRVALRYIEPSGSTDTFSHRSYRADGTPVFGRGGSTGGYPILLTEKPTEPEPEPLLIDVNKPMRLTDGRRVELVETSTHMGRAYATVRYPEGGNNAHYLDDGVWIGDDRKPRLENYEAVEELVEVRKHTDGSVFLKTTVGMWPISAGKAEFLPVGTARLSEDRQKASFTVADDAGTGDVEVSIGFLKRLAA